MKETAQLERLREQEKSYVRYLKDTRRKIKQVEKTLQESPTVAELVGKYFMAQTQDHMYQIIGPADKASGGTAERAEISNTTLEFDTGSLYISKGTYPMDIERITILSDQEITPEQFAEIQELWEQSLADYKTQHSALVRKHLEDRKEQSKNILESSNGE